MGSFNLGGGLYGAGEGAKIGTMISPGWGTAIGGVVGGLAGGFLKKDDVLGDYVRYPGVDTAQSASTAINANLQNQDALESLLSRSNTFNQSQNLSLLNQAMPGWEQYSKRMSKLATDMTENPYELPKEVEENLSRLAAERGISAGTRGQFNDFSLLRDFGINSLQYGQSNLSQAQGIMSSLASISKVNPMSPMSFYVTPEQQISVDQDTATKQWQGDQAWANAQADAENKENAGIWEGAQSLFSAGGAIGGMFGKGGGGGGGILGGLFCWVAREVYGENDPKWLKFRDWMLHRAPENLRDIYEKHGPGAALEIRNQPEIKAVLRGLMDNIIEQDERGQKGGA